MTPQYTQSDLERAKLEARIEELSHVQLAYGNYGATTYINDMPQGIEDRIIELQAALKERAVRE